MLRGRQAGRPQAFAEKGHTSVINFLQMGRISWESVAENIMTCLSCGVCLKMSCISARMSAQQ